MRKFSGIFFCKPIIVPNFCFVSLVSGFFVNISLYKFLLYSIISFVLLFLVFISLLSIYSLSKFIPNFLPFFSSKQIESSQVVKLENVLACRKLFIEFALFILISLSSIKSDKNELIFFSFSILNFFISSSFILISFFSSLLTDIFCI